MAAIVGRTLAVFKIYICFLLSLECLVLKSYGCLTSCLAFQGILSGCLYIFVHKQEENEVKVRENQGDFGAL
jgi:hypothetical protein